MSGKYIALNDAIHSYVLAHRSHANDPVQEELLEETRKLGEVAQMSIGLDQASLIGLLVAAIGTKSAVEIGTFTGMSSIAIARYLLPGGKLVCFDQDFRYTSIARRYWIKANVQDRIELRLGDAHRLLPHYKPRELIDFVFIDADKESYDFYYETIMPFVRTGGLILFDNMLRGGELIDPVRKQKPANKAIDTLNRKLATDPRVQCVLVSIADGLTICRKNFVAGMDGRHMGESRRSVI
jgi:caffeoyl-CoA O-methyltransferase